VDPATALGLSADVWVDGRDRDPVKESLVIAHALHWAPVLTKALRRNKEEGREPRSYQELAGHLRRDLRNVYRWKAGKYSGSTPDFLALSMIVNVPVREFFPQEAWWVGRAAALLCGDEIPMADCLVYGAYSAAGPRRSNPELDPQAVAQVVAGLGDTRDPSKLEETIVATARRVGGVLLDHGWVFPRRRWEP